jgi:hypothetical protein
MLDSPYAKVGFVAFFGCMMIFIGTMDTVHDIIRQDEPLTTWVPVEAYVIDSYHAASPDSSPARRLLEDIFGTGYGVAVSYRYKVDGKEYAKGWEKDPPLNSTAQMLVCGLSEGCDSDKLRTWISHQQVAYVSQIR